MTLGTRPAYCALALLTLQDVPSPLPGLPPPEVVAHRVVVLRDWVAAVERHAPGEFDSAAVSVSAWSRGDVQIAWLDVQVLLALVHDKRATRFVAQVPDQKDRVPVVISRQDLVALQDLAARLRQRYDPFEPFLYRAAVLHSDIATSVQSADTATLWSSMLSPSRVVVRAEDGQQVSMHGAMVHWEFGRLLLDAVREPGRDEFVRRWYRATLAYKLRMEELDTPHFDRARDLLRDDPVIRFQLGCLREAFADPRVQAVAREARLPPGTHLLVRSERDELRAAEEEFRRALDLDPADAEARLRRGRTLARLDRHKEAAAELRVALAATQEPLLTYYGQLFLAGEEEALGRFPEARAAYQAAAVLYPRAQAPKMGLSQLAHRLGDRPAARRALGAVLQPGDGKRETDDPWWSYRVAAGRRADDMLAAVHRSLERGSR